MKKYATVCSGINAPAVAWNSMGWEEQFCAEIESFPCSVLKQRHAEAPNLGDITKYADWPDFGIELLAGGTPCQSFSLAGLRKGMDDPRGQLTKSYIAIAAKYRPQWLVWENVPGVFSADSGEAFAGFLAGLTGRKVKVPAEGWGSFGILPGIPEAYGIAWRVLDTQFVRVDTHPRACPQRRERVFVVGHFGGCWQRAAAVLLERESLCGNPAPRRTAGQRATGTLSARTEGGGGLGTDFECSGGVVPVAATLDVRAGRSGETSFHTSGGLVSHSLTGVESDASEDGTGRGTPLVAVPEVCGTLSDGAHNGGGLNGQDAPTVRILPIAFDTTQITSRTNRSNPKAGDPCHPLAEGQHPPAITGYFSPRAIRNSDSSNGCGITEGEVHDALQTDGPGAVAFDLRGREGGSQFEGPHHTANIRAASGGSSRSYVAATAVRRLTPTECARLQGFPDDHLNVIHNGKPAKDGPKYRALGNAMSVNVMRWIAQRIEMVDGI